MFGLWIPYHKTRPNNKFISVQLCTIFMGSNEMPFNFFFKNPKVEYEINKWGDILVKCTSKYMYIDLKQGKDNKMGNYLTWWRWVKSASQTKPPIL